MTFQAIGQYDTRWRLWALLALAWALWPAAPAYAADEPDLIFRRSTVFKWISPNDKLATYGVDDPEVEGVACHFTVPERGGFKGWLGLAEEVSDISLACRQIGPIRFKAKSEQGEDMFRQRRSLFFKKMQIVRGCDAKRNVLVYMVYSDRIIEGSPKNSTSSVPIMPWGADAIPRFRNAASSFSERRQGVEPAAIAWAGRGAPMARPRALGSRQPTSWTNFCGAETLPLSPHCCDMAPQLPALIPASLDRSGGLRSAVAVGILLPTSMLAHDCSSFA